MITCGNRLEDTGRTVDAAGMCCGQQVQAVYRCAVKGECVAQGIVPGIQSCAGCDVQNRPATFPTVKPLTYQQIPFTGRAAETGAYNCSLHVDDGSGFAFAFRSGWTKSDIRLCRLTDSYKPTGMMAPLFSLHPRAVRGREDPRLFKFRGQWHVAYAGYEKGTYFCSVLIARLGKWPTVEKLLEPIYAKRTNAEKNWGFFDYGGELHAVYKIGPEHRILKFSGERVVEEYSTTWQPGWKWGEMRGGASPILHNGEWHSWFHGFKRDRSGLTYTAGLYTFENKPPFKPLRIVPDAIAVGGFSHMENGKRKSIIYPCGAGFKNGRWHISAGEHDNRCVVLTFDADEIEAALTPVKVGQFTRPEIDTILSLNGWCDERKANHIAELVAAIPERVNGVEIGVFAGRSLFAAAVGVRSNPNGGHVQGIDSYSAEENLRGVDTPEHRRHWPQYLVDEAQAAMWSARERLGLTPFCDVTVGKSGDVADTVPGPLNYLHIDGNHSSAGAVLDAELYLPKVSIGGLVLVDDTHPDGKNEFLDGVAYAVEVVERSCELIEDHGTWRVYRKVN